ncbi:MAG: hypothetical protein K2R93_04030 [Gemmatimonadaceae bacterium]|nr:hypothetical protein [Gemmatimonadaceae bacterium]
MSAAPIATPSDSVPALFSHVTDEHPLPSIREFLSSDATTERETSGELPWIDQFLANTPVAPMEAIAGPPDAYRYSTPISSPVIVPNDALESAMIESAMIEAAMSEVEAAAEAPVLEPESAPKSALEAEPDAAPIQESASPYVADTSFAQPTPLYNTPVSFTPVASHTPLRVDAVPPFVPPYVPPAEASAEAAAETEIEPVSEPIAEPVGEPIAERFETHAPEAVTEPVADEWPLAETAHALDELARDLSVSAAEAAENPARLFSEPADAAALPAWSDDDLLNIMPTRPVTPVTGTPIHATPVQALFAEEAEPEQAAADASAIAAAQALEVLAQRVRNGELQLPGYDPRMGDAAALVSALAALLGIRLG